MRLSYDSHASDRKSRTAAGQELLALTRTFGKIATPEHATSFHAEFISWASKWNSMLKQRTYLNGGQTPKLCSSWCHMVVPHRELRQAYRFLHGLILHRQLFTWMNAAHEHKALPKTKPHRTPGTA